MKTAAIDIGSNSVRLLIIDREMRELHRESNVTGLARGVDAGGFLSKVAVSETVQVITRYARAIEILGVDRVGAVATSASRDATNGREVMDCISDVLGVEPAIIDGEREAHLAFTGAVSHLPGSDERVVIDIGGGSTEIIHGTESVSWSHSYDIGSVRITDRHLPSKPASRDDAAAAEADATSIFSDPAIPSANGAEVVGVAGSFANLASIALGLDVYDSAEVHGSKLTREQVSQLVERFMPMTLNELQGIPAMHAKRAAVILGGAIVAGASMDAVGASALTISAHGLLDGLARDLMTDGTS